MALSSDLISKFVKATNDDKKNKSESIVFGTTREYDGAMYVQLDGSELLTPIVTATDIQAGERVTVMIKNHTATVTGNLTNPSASSSTVTKIQEDIKNIVTVENLEAVNAEIINLKSEKLDVADAVITYATIEKLEATDAEIDTLQASYASFSAITTEELEAIKADVDKLQAGEITTEELDAKYATIVDLNTERARIDVLEADKVTAEEIAAKYATITDLDTERARIDVLEAGVADIDTLIFGSASGTTIQTSFANAVIAQLGNAQIKSAMIESVSADQITAGDIITNNVRVMSEDGKLIISDETIQISDSVRVRVQIGKDSSDDYSINIWDADGNLMFSEGGITDSAIKEAIIRNDMVSDTANIAAHKLDIASLFEEINGSAHTIQSSKILMDAKNQTLDVVFTDMTTDITVLEETISTQGTLLSVVQGQIASKIWEEDISLAIDNIEVGGRNLFGFHKGVGVGPVVSTVSSVVKNEDTYGVTATVDAEYNGNLLRLSHLGFNVIDIGNEPFTFSAMIYASIDDCAINMDICDAALASFTISTTPRKISFTSYPASYCTSTDPYYNGFVDLSANKLPIGTVIYLEKIKIERGTKATDFTVAPEDLEYVTDNLSNQTTVLSTQYSELKQTVDGITATVATHTTEIESKADSSEVVAVSNQISTLSLTVDDFQTEVETAYATKGELEGVTESVEANKTAIEQNASQIALRATTTEVENLINNIDVGGRNLLLATATSIEFPETEEFTAYSRYKTYKFSPIVLNDLKAFMLSLKNGESFILSFDVNIPSAYKNSSLTLSRIGAYFSMLFTHTDGTKTYWYGTHSSEGVKTNRHTIDAFDVNSLISFSETEKSYVGRYSCYITPSKSYSTLLKNFYSNPDDYTVSCAGLSVEFGGFTTGGTISNFKMEVGTKATDWTPAPEDLETRVTTAEASISVNADNITSVAARTTANENSISTLEQTSTSLTSRITVAENDISNNAILATNAQNTADDAQSAAANAQNDIDNLEIGARNLALHTAQSISHTMTATNGNDSWNACNTYWSHGIVLEAGKTYTLSFDYIFDWGEVEKPTAAAGIGAGIGSDNDGTSPGSYLKDAFAMMADYWKYGDGGYDSGRYVYTFTNTQDIDIHFAFRMLRSYHSSSQVDVTGVTLTISNFKVEMGTQATDWTPAPEDMATSNELDSIQSSTELIEGRVSTAESLIEQLADSISMLVTDENGESLMVQTDTGWTFSTAQIQSTIDTTSENLDSLTNEMGDVNSTVVALQQAVDDLGILNDYVKIGTYENEPCIELGESDSDFKLLITNTRIMFMEGSNVPAYLNNQSLYIHKAVIEEELQQGAFVWKIKSNGNLGLVWKGVSS